MTGIGFIGLGGMGMYQVASFAKIGDAKIVAGADPSEEARQRFTGEVETATAYEDHRQLLEDPKVEAVVIVVPTGLHEEMTVDALRAGKHVLTEKPMARTVAECKTMMREAEKADRVLMVAHCRRFDPHWGGFKKLVEKNRIGRPIVWRQTMAGRGPGGWFMDDKLGGGPLMDGAIHNWDYANWLFGDPQRVVAMGTTLRDVTAITTATAVVEYPDGDQVSLTWSWGTPSYGGVFDDLGPDGTIVFGPADEQVSNEPGTTYYTEIRDDGQRKLHEVKPAARHTDMYVNQGRHFLKLATGKETVNQSPGEEAIKAVAVADTILKTARRGGAAKVKW